MARRNRGKKAFLGEVPAILREKARGPLAFALGAPAEVTHVLATLDASEVVCYQMDLYFAERLRETLEERNLPARVETAADLWDLPGEFQSVIYLPMQGGERELKIDMIEQAFHLLRPGGALLV